MKKKTFIYIGFVCIVVLIISVLIFREKVMISIHPDEIVSAEIYSEGIRKNEVQVMAVTRKPDVAEVIEHLSEIKPSDHSLSLDGNYIILFNKTDGTRLIYSYANGIVTTSNGFKGRTNDDNIINRLWAKLDYPVRNLTEKETSSLNGLIAK
ncbi:hypothetical protein [Paenibacillus sp. FSL H8-0079]|uniref:hypothetical protein n=1 Tax=Paenibacillus sp. FSL H8-0079 TaxID=2921375 RepID=UPI0030EC00DF